jgi:para-nitrobenzyl esterase
MKSDSWHPSTMALAAMACIGLLSGVGLLPAAAPVVDEIGPTATVAGGQIRGRLLSDGAGAVFKGIPFAQPPVGELRWREPQPVLPWPGIRDAGESGPPCAQNSSGWNEKESIASREDCLYLDVWAPEWPVKASRPVMVWIHGGANTGGAGGSDPLYEGTHLIAHGVVLVIVEYRLGVFGFLAHPELTAESPHHSSGNYGILDQVASLKWVRDNIATFGGDPGNVTVFGQSAGGADTTVLMSSPLTTGLFHRAIIESGPTPGALPLSKAEAQGLRLAESAKAPAHGAVRFLRTLSTAQVLKLQGGGMPAPPVDGWLLERSPAEVFAAGQQQPIPLIAGTNAIELPGPSSLDELRKAIESRYGDLAPKALALYGLAPSDGMAPSDELYGSPGDQWATDTMMRCPTVLQAKWHAAAGHAVWTYEFDRAIPPKPTVVHSSELPYVFGNLFSWGSQAGEYTDMDRALSSAMQAYWTSFAKTGDPNTEGFPAWPRFENGRRDYLRLGRTGDLSVQQNERAPYCDLYGESVKGMPARR